MKSNARRLWYVNELAKVRRALAEVEAEHDENAPDPFGDDPLDDDAPLGDGNPPPPNVWRTCSGCGYEFFGSIAIAVCPECCEGTRETDEDAARRYAEMMQ